MFLNRQVLAPGHNTNIQTILGKDDHTYAKPWTDNQTTLTQTKILCIDEKGVQVMTETEDVETVSPELGFFLSAFRPSNVPSKQIPA
jgi:nicotinic acid mononucleotide adenylyltransferase